MVDTPLLTPDNDRFPTFVAPQVVWTPRACFHRLG